MKFNQFNNSDCRQMKSNLTQMLMAVVFVGLIASPGMVFAQDGLADAQTRVCGFFGSITKLLRYASIAVVTIAVIFAGYQIAFAHKRIADVAPILIGGLLIGAAGQIAAMLLPEGDTNCENVTLSDGGMALLHALLPAIA